MLPLSYSASKLEAVVAAISILSSHSLMTVSSDRKGIVIGSRLGSEIVIDVYWGSVGFLDPSPTSACSYASFVYNHLHGNTNNLPSINTSEVKRSNTYNQILKSTNIKCLYCAFIVNEDLGVDKVISIIK
ncbi:hypothetical protein Tco_1305282 [Tanacetum coccineum]